jgi:hypothetical protein
LELFWARRLAFLGDLRDSRQRKIRHVECFVTEQFGDGRAGAAGEKDLRPNAACGGEVASKNIIYP